MKGEISNYTVDLGANRKREVNESFLEMFGAATKMILQSMFSGTTPPVTIIGTKSEITSFGKAIEKEASYMKAYKEFGLSDPRTYQNKYRLESAIQKFESTTGLRWPFK